MSRMVRLGVLVGALLSLSGLVAGTAGAVTWHNSGNTAFTATSGPTTLSSTGITLTCASTDVGGTTGVSPFGGATWVAATGTAQFTGCAVSGVSTVVTCTYAVTATSWVSTPPGITSGNADATCLTTSTGGTPICVTEGPIAGSYTNPTAGNGRATLLASSTLRSTNPGTGTCPLGNGDPLTFVSTTAFTITSASGGTGTQGPVVTRTA
jgi:hypothetical protein